MVADNHKHAHDPQQHKAKKRKLDKKAAPKADAAVAAPAVAPPTSEPTGWEELEQDNTAQQQAAPSADPGAAKPHLSKHAKKRLKEEREKAIRTAELQRLEGGAAPTSVTEFEQLVMTSPNASYVWVKYLAFLISLGELEKARALADRALSTINYREEAERFNVWVAYLNMENMYGSEEGTLQLLSRALAHTDARRMYLAAVDIFDRTDKAALVEQCLKAMTRKFSEAPEVWLRALKYRLTQGDSEGARKTLDRSLQSLPKFEHIRMISQAALLEFKLGDAERGRSLFEGVLRNYPKRLDLWSVYLDQEIAAGEQQRIRALFERATHLQLPPKKMKFLFKRYLEYEKKEGTAATVEHVKRRAMEFVQAVGGGGA